MPPSMCNAKRLRIFAFAAMVLSCTFPVTVPAFADGIVDSVAPPAPSAAERHRPTTGLASIDNAIAAQESGDVQAALLSYTDAIALLNLIVSQPLSAPVAKVARDRLAFAVMQTAVLQRGQVSPIAPLRYAYRLERKYLSHEIRVASVRFSQRRFADGFTIYRVFATRAGDDTKTGRAHDLFAAITAASEGKYSAARLMLIDTMRRGNPFGNAFPLYLLGEVDRAISHDSDADENFWRALDERESGYLENGLYGPQILAAGALVNEF